MVDKNLIFLISQPRSGSTLLQKLLSNHPDILTVGEPWILLPGLFNGFSGNINNSNPDYGKYTATRAINEFEKEYKDAKKTQKEALRVYYLKKYELLLKQEEDKRLFLDKTPRYYLIIDEIRELFPNSKIIVLVRNPIAVLNSIITTWTKKKYFKLGAFKNDLLEAPKIIHRLKKENLDNNLYYINYEQLVTNPKDELKSVLEFIGVHCDNVEKMIEKIDSTKWVLGDPENVYKYKTVKEETSSSWQKNIKNIKFRTLTKSYLDLLGKEVITGLGYNFDDLKNKLGKSNKTQFSFSPKLSFYFHPCSRTIGKGIRLWETIINKIFKKK